MRTLDCLMNELNVWMGGREVLSFPSDHVNAGIFRIKGAELLQIENAILKGEIDKAIKIIQEASPRSLKDSNAKLLLLLYQQKVKISIKILAD